MTQIPIADAAADALPLAPLPYTVSGLSVAIRKTLEGSFGHVRVRGEVSGFKLHGPGNLYLSLKDDAALISAVCWKGHAQRLNFMPQDGMEIIATGRLTTYGGRSQYQLVIEHVELAGQGALLQLLEQRKKDLAAEGLFALDRKQSLPFLPEVIGVITSPTGAVIQDILHRLADRFPRHVIVWPVPVQGESAAHLITRAIYGFQGLLPDGTPLSSPLPCPTPDVLILARGGGSLEDLWCFNEPSVVRAVAACTIPIITAVGHETDTTLVDYAADVRAPTPTAAAELVVPVRRDLIVTVKEAQHRLHRMILSRLQRELQLLTLLRRPLSTPRRLVEPMQQRVDDLRWRLPQGLRSTLAQGRLRLQYLKSAVRPPEVAFARAAQSLKTAHHRLVQSIGPQLARQKDHVKAQQRLLASLSYTNILYRGFTLVTDPKGRLMTTLALAAKSPELSVRFSDGDLAVTPLVSGAPERRKKTKKDDLPQLPSLFDEA